MKTMFKSILVALSFLLFSQPIQAKSWGNTRSNDSLNRLKVMYQTKDLTIFEHYRQVFNHIETLSDWANVYRMAVAQRHTLAKPMAQAQEDWLTQNSGEQPDFSWAESLFPGFQLAYVAEGTVLELFVNYEDFAALARKTSSPEDNAFIQLMIHAHGPTFTYYPLWFAQTWDYGGCSFAGKGIHIERLNEMQNVLKLGATFVPEIKDLKTALIKDLTESQYFCQSKASAFQEIQSLIKHPLLDATEQAALKKRLQELNSDKKLEFNCLSEGVGCSFG